MTVTSDLGLNFFTLQVSSRAEREDTTTAWPCQVHPNTLSRQHTIYFVPRL